MAGKKIAPLGVIPLGDSAAYVEFSTALDLDVNSVVQRLGLVILKRSVPWVRDVVPALGGLALHFDPDHAEFPLKPLEEALALVTDCMKPALAAKDNPGSEIELPVCYEPEFALDLKEVAKKAELSPEEVASRHAAAEYRVLMMGFAPGHAYMGGLDPKLTIPRRASPRAVVPAGSVAIANEQTVVYPYAISGGWNVIGRTPMTLFDASRPRPSLLWPGDRVLPRDYARGIRRNGRSAMSVRVLRPGLLTTLQDEGRHGYQRIGLCPGGAMDPVALALANALVGNPPGEAALEITVIGPEVMFEQDTLVAVCGAEFQGSFPHNRPTLARAGSRFSVGRAVRGARAYLAVAGGFAVDPVLGSRSTYLPGHFGGVQGRALKHGDVLPLRDPEAAQRFTSLKKTREGTVKWSAPPLTLPDREPILVHVIDGQHFASFDASSQRAFVDTVWSVAPESNRMGFRLSGPPLGRPQGDEILSGPTCLGSVQVPPSGVPIALMADHQTTGGYPRIAEIASADVARLAQLAPGGKVHFARCSLEMAGELRKHARERLQSALRGIAWEYAKK